MKDSVEAYVIDSFDFDELYFSHRAS